MANIKNCYHELESLSLLERKEYEELKAFYAAKAARQRERAIYLGFVTIAVLATLLISGAMDFENWRSLIW